MRRFILLALALSVSACGGSEADFTEGDAATSDDADDTSVQGDAGADTASPTDTAAPEDTALADTTVADTRVDSSLADSSGADSSGTDSATVDGAAADTAPVSDTGADDASTSDTSAAADALDDSGVAIDASEAGVDAVAPTECVVDSDCANVGKSGQICGIASPNLCGPCSNDTHCQSSTYGASTICNIGAGVCVPGACGTPNATCTANPADICCSPGSGSARCIPGTCCSDAQCTGSEVCRNNVCTSCVAVTNNTFYVDPLNGSNTGNSGASTCPFRSITRAVQYINATFGSAIPAGTKILVRNDSLVSNATRGENFPITVPTNVIISSESARVVIEIAGGANGFNLANPSSGLSNLTLEGKSAAYTGVRVGVNASNSTTSLTDVTIQNMRNDGVYVENAGLRIGHGVLATKNGTNPTQSGLGNGLDVRGGNVVINVPSGQSKAGFDENAGNGILVMNSGSVTITGVPDVTGFPGAAPPAVTNGTGTVTANGNTLANLGIAQSGNSRPLNVINGLVTWGGKGNGMTLQSGSAVGVRNSVSAKNAASGVRIEASFNGGISGTYTINLGPDSLGRNIFQSTTNGNTNAGICISGQFYNAMQTLLARANYFAGKDCSAAATTPRVTVTSSLNGCSGGIDVGIERTPGMNQQQTNIRVELDNCQDL